MKKLISLFLFAMILSAGWYPSHTRLVKWPHQVAWPRQVMHHTESHRGPAEN